MLSNCPQKAATKAALSIDEPLCLYHRLPIDWEAHIRHIDAATLLGFA